jgi:hypothetical protein
LDERASRREVVDIEVEAQIGGKPCRAFVYDLSCDGCSLELRGDGELRRGDLVVLSFPSAGRVAGRIIWRIRLKGGVQFCERIGAAAVERLSFRPNLPDLADDRLFDGFGRPVPRPRGGHKVPSWDP